MTNLNSEINLLNWVLMSLKAHKYNEQHGKFQRLLTQGGTYQSNWRMWFWKTFTGLIWNYKLCGKWKRYIMLSISRNRKNRSFRISNLKLNEKRYSTLISNHFSTSKRTCLANQRWIQEICKIFTILSWNVLWRNPLKHSY